MGTGGKCARSFAHHGSTLTSSAGARIKTGASAECRRTDAKGRLNCAVAGGSGGGSEAVRVRRPLRYASSVAQGAGE
eukprot:1196386-Prorocentrum_minimum.AAC.3